MAGDGVIANPLLVAKNRPWQAPPQAEIMPGAKKPGLNRSKNKLSNT